MKASIVSLSLGCLVAGTASFGQDLQSALPRAPVPAPTGSPTQASRGGVPAASPFAGQGIGAASSEKADPKVFPASSVLPTPTPPDQLKPATIALPNDAIEPWLLTKNAGPFMVLARTFRGPEAERYALALAIELKRDYGLPAYILRTKDFPNRSNIRNVPPTADAFMAKARLTDPEKTRTYDEAAVLVGNEQTLDASEKLLQKVRKIKPVCLNEMPSIFNWRSGLTTALRTTNPFVATQNLFPGRGKRDKLISQMNAGPRSIYNCPGRYTLQVAEFGGRSVFNPDQKAIGVFGNEWLRKSPLVTAADDAEKLADMLAKDPDVQRTGCQPYIYHDRTTSKVMMGAFNDPSDPIAPKLRDTLLKVAVPLASKHKGMVIAPANQLTDLEDPNVPIKVSQAK